MRSPNRRAALALAAFAALALACGSARAIDLAAYRLVAGPLQLEGVENLSGITYAAATHTLLGIQNKPTRIVELDLAGKQLRAINLTGFDDTEDLVSLGNSRLAVIEERRRTLTVVTVDPAANTIARPKQWLLIEPKQYENVGLEGIAYDPAGDRFTIVKEKTPRAIYSVSRTAKPGDDASVTHPWDLEAGGFGLSDISGITFDPTSGHLLVLSDDSRTVVEATTNGVEVARLPLTAGSAGLTADLVQPEGIALDDAGRLYIVCEPNVFCVFAKP